MDLVNFRFTESIDTGAVMGLGMVGNELYALVTLREQRDKVR
jgi:hypothetical protein